MRKRIWPTGSIKCVSHLINAFTKKQLEELWLLSSGKKLVDEFEMLSFAFDERIGNNNNENNILTSIRDTLLPKIISGKLRVPDAEKHIQEGGL